ncbi:MAG: hypothetical protein HYX34_16305, partial [Actinobacteria bacterium]|nr:hypothetical protein [Actinomycetota bacterium]
MRRTVRLIATAALMAGIVVGIQATPSSATDQPTTKTIRYGSYTIPAASGGTMGMLKNKLNLWISKPCTNCYITSMTPNLVYADGSKANVANGPVLHHMVLASQFRSDPTCGSNLLGLVGERFFASGNERT